MPKYRERGTAHYEMGPVEAKTAAEAARALSELTPRLGENEYSYLEKWDEESQDWLLVDELDDEDDWDEEEDSSSDVTSISGGMAFEDFMKVLKKTEDEDN